MSNRLGDVDGGDGTNGEWILAERCTKDLCIRTVWSAESLLARVSMERVFDAEVE